MILWIAFVSSNTIKSVLISHYLSLFIITYEEHILSFDNLSYFLMDQIRLIRSWNSFFLFFLFFFLFRLNQVKLSLHQGGTWKMNIRLESKWSSKKIFDSVNLDFKPYIHYYSASAYIKSHLMSRLGLFDHSYKKGRSYWLGFKNNGLGSHYITNSEENYVLTLFYFLSSRSAFLFINKSIFTSPS
jgi:hypothetical protein